MVLLHQAFVYFCCSAEGDNSVATVTFCFGLAATKKATTELSSPSLL
jgi:hypothetical protein